MQNETGLASEPLVEEGASPSAGRIDQPVSAPVHGLAFALIVGCTVIGLAGVDLVLPAIPLLPHIIGGDHAQAQLVIATFVAGSACGLLLFGTLAARHDQRTLLLFSLLAYGGVSAAAAAVQSIEALVGLRFLQGAAGSAAAAFAPGMLRAIYGDKRAVSALGLLGSVEALTPALAPIAGLWLLQSFGWNASFQALAIASALLAAALLLSRRHLVSGHRNRPSCGYLRLLLEPTFLRYAFSHAFTLGALLVVVFAAPSVLTVTMSGTVTNFIMMQAAGIFTFIVAANTAGRLVRLHGSERLIWWGTSTAAAGALSLLGYALAGGNDPFAVTLMFVPINLGLGLRGPPGFHQAILASSGDDARGAALVVVATLGSSAAGTALVAPFITRGLLPVALAASVLLLGALLLLRVLPPLGTSRLRKDIR